MRIILGAIGITALVLAGCSTASEPEPTVTTVEPTSTTTVPAAALDRLPDPVRILAIGDSFTEGTSIAFEGSWPAQLAEVLGEDRSVVLDVVAGDGWNAKRLDREFSRAWDGSTYDLVFVGIGANDVVLPFGLENYREGLGAIGGAVEAASSDTTELVVLSIPDFRASPWGQDRADRGYEIETYNAALESFAEDIGASFVDITTTSGQSIGDPAMFADDDLHFSAVQYALWVDLILETLS